MTIVKKYKPEIQQIHDEAKTAFEEIIKEANNLIDESVERKANRLEKVGFKNNPEVKRGKKAKEARAIKQLVDHYNFHYPQNKFINEKRVDEICKKYNLYVGAIANYIGYVPEFALEEIENFKVKKEDLPENNPGVNEFFNFDRDTPVTVQMLPDILSIERDDVGIGAGFVELLPGAQRVRIEGYLVGPVTQLTQVQSQLQIIAPEKDFQFRNKFKVGRKLIEDPIVLQPVKGGYLIVTAWGDEAKEVDNPNKN